MAYRFLLKSNAISFGRKRLEGQSGGVADEDVKETGETESGEGSGY